MGNYGKGNTEWFVRDRFGMFIHWGLYSMPARHEWIRHYEKITDEDYRKYFDHFNPDLFQPREWARTAREAGMKYVVFTTKHHEGFCMWDSRCTDYKVTNTPCGRDLVREVVDAFRAEGLKIGFYYSLIDWHHPDFITDNRVGPYRELSEAELRKRNEGRDRKRYAKYMRDQVTELLTGYGKIDILWFDFSYPDPSGENNPEHGKGRLDWESEELVRLVRSLQPEIILDDRCDLPGAGDVKTPEQYTPDQQLRNEDGTPAVWEGCQTFSGSWGYFRDEMTWKSPKQCIDLLINHVSRGGNLLMNVGPTGRGYFDSRALHCLRAYGEWMKYHSRAIYGCTAAPAEFAEPKDCRYTFHPERNTLYLHLMNWPFKHIHLPGLAGKVAYAQFLHDGSEVIMREQSNEVHDNLNSATPESAVTLELPVLKPDAEVPVIELFLKS